MNNVKTVLLGSNLNVLIIDTPIVDVKSGYSTRYDVIVTDVLIYDKQNKKEHYHLVIDDYGNELFSEWRPNH